jgi:hypothetical protein
VRKHAPDACDQAIEFDRVGIELVAPIASANLALPAEMGKRDETKFLDARNSAETHAP